MTSTDDRGAMSQDRGGRPLRIAWFGTSTMEHYEAYNRQMQMQSDLPAVGSTVAVEGWAHGGWVRRLQLELQACWPSLRFEFINQALGGATSRDLRSIVAAFLQRDEGGEIDLVFYGCSVNDVWRSFQGRHEEAVGLAEFEENYRDAVAMLSDRAGNVICVGDAPIGWDPAVDVLAMNRTLVDYQRAAERCAQTSGAAFIDVWAPFGQAAENLAASGSAAPSLWSDGAHFSELGDTVVLQRVRAHVLDQGVIERCARAVGLGNDLQGSCAEPSPPIP